MCILRSSFAIVGSHLRALDEYANSSKNLDVHLNFQLCYSRLLSAAASSSDRERERERERERVVFFERRFFENIFDKLLGLLGGTASFREAQPRESKRRERRDEKRGRL